MKAYGLPLRIYYEDTDAGGIVYHANYLKYFERARTEALRSVGLELEALRCISGLHFVVQSAEVHFLKSAFLDQQLWISTQVIEVRAASLRFQQRAHLETPEGALLCEARIRLASLDHQHRIIRLPDNVKKGITT